MALDIIIGWIVLFAVAVVAGQLPVVGDFFGSPTFKEGMVFGGLFALLQIGLLAVRQRRTKREGSK